MKLQQEIKNAELIIFDFDGSIVDSLDTFLLAFQRTLLHFEKTCTLQEAKNNLGPCSFANIRTHYTPKSYKVLSKLLKGAPERKIKKAHLYFQKQVISNLENIRAFDDVPKVILSISKNKKTALLTNSSKKYTCAILDRLKLTYAFSICIYGDSGFKEKAAGIRHIMRQFKISPEKTVYVGDAPLDIKAAKKAGCTSVSIPRWFPLSEIKKEKPDFIIKNMGELIH